MESELTQERFFHVYPLVKHPSDKYPVVNYLIDNAMMPDNEHAQFTNGRPNWISQFGV